MSLSCRFEQLIRHYRRGLINEAEFTLAFIGRAIYEPDSLANASLDLTEAELGQLIACAAEHADKQSFRRISGGFIVDHNEVGVQEQRARELRPLFNRIVDWFEENLKRKREVHEPLPFQLAPYRPEFLRAGSNGLLTMARIELNAFTRLKDLGHVEFFREYPGHAPMLEAVTQVCSRDYPVDLYGYHHSISSFRVTTSRTRHLREGDWTIGFGWDPTSEGFGFSLWEVTSRGQVALPGRVCERSDFADAIDELIDRMAAGKSSQLWRFETGS